MPDTVQAFGRGWKRALKLKDLLGPDDSPEEVRRVAREMSDRLKKLPDYEEGDLDGFSEIVDEMADIATSSAADYAAENSTISRHFNDVLSALYDWADAERVWIA